MIFVEEINTNTMLSNISWNQYAAFLTVVVFTYYVIVLSIFYRKSIFHYLNRFINGTNPDAINVFEQEENGNLFSSSASPELSTITSKPPLPWRHFRPSRVRRYRTKQGPSWDKPVNPRGSLRNHP